jgi:hypothetical protein
MVINFNIHKISRNMCKLAVILTLKKIEAIFIRL